MNKTATVQADFDRIALLAGDGWDHNNHYHAHLLKHTPLDCANALEIGCGTGAFSRLLARRAKRVCALDLSPQMIRIAEERSRQYANIDFQVADAMSEQLPEAHFDCIASIATLHHLPFAKMIERMKGALKAGGTLLVLDLFQTEGVTDALASMLALPASAALRLIHQRRLRPSREVRAAWAEHARHDVFLTMSELRRTCATLLPGALVRQHLFWRYSIVWQKPQDV